MGQEQNTVLLPGFLVCPRAHTLACCGGCPRAAAEDSGRVSMWGRPPCGSSSSSSSSDEQRPRERGRRASGSASRHRSRAGPAVRYLSTGHRYLSTGHRYLSTGHRIARGP
eukprot:1707674-Rhodomonas_salina.3